jgi:LysM repeat protein
VTDSETTAPKSSADESSQETMESTTPPTVAIRPNFTIQPSPRRHTSATQQNVSWRNKKSRSSTDDDAPPRDDDAASPIVHRVQRGDTLSRLAQRYLGDYNRYNEIFEANRDQLQSPDDRLRVGMSLRIPQEGAKRVRTGPIASRKSGARSKEFLTGQARTSRSRQVPMRNVSRTRDERSMTADEDQAPTGQTSDEKSPAATTDDAETAKSTDRFVPVKRSPFMPRNTQSNSGDSGSSSGRSLSQTPPEDSAESQSSEESPGVSQFRFFPKGESPTVLSRRSTVLQ